MLGWHGSLANAGATSILSLSTFDIAFCCTVMVLCYALRGSTGFGAAAAMPLLGLVIPLKLLIPAWTLVGLAASITLVGHDRHHIAWTYILRLAPACLAGVLIGLYLFSSLELGCARQRARHPRADLRRLFAVEDLPPRDALERARTAERRRPSG